MALKRITLATDTLRDFIALTPAQQKILVFLLSNRNMRDRSERPTQYFSYRQIAEETGLKESSVRILIIALTKEKWIVRINQRKRYTPQGKKESEFRWSITKVVDELEKTYQEEAEVVEFDPADDPNLFLHDERLWRPGGSLGWQYRKRYAQNGGWADTTLAPDAVIDFFSEN